MSGRWRIGWTAVVPVWSLAVTHTISAGWWIPHRWQRLLELYWWRNCQSTGVLYRGHRWLSAFPGEWRGLQCQKLSLSPGMWHMWWGRSGTGCTGGLSRRSGLWSSSVLAGILIDGGWVDYLLLYVCETDCAQAARTPSCTWVGVTEIGL